MEHRPETTAELVDQLYALRDAELHKLFLRMIEAPETTIIAPDVL